MEIALESAATVSVELGGFFTIELAIDNASEISANAIFVDITGLAGVGIVESGVSSDGYFYGICLSVCFSGIPTNNNDFFDNTDLSGDSVGSGYVDGDDTVRVVWALTCCGTSNTGAIDPGVNGVLGEHDPTDVSIVLQLVGMPTHPLIVSSVFNSVDIGATFLPDLVINVVLIPEPGTALLLGLGLAGLATASVPRSRSSIQSRRPGRSPAATA